MFSRAHTKNLDTYHKQEERATELFIDGIRIGSSTNPDMTNTIQQTTNYDSSYPL